MVPRSFATAVSIADRLAAYSALPVLRCDSILSIAPQPRRIFVAEYESRINGPGSEPEGEVIQLRFDE
jgi:hypothetical protein